MEKHVIQGKVQTSNQKIFTVQAVAASEQDVQLHFDHAIDHEVVKLDIQDLPSEDAQGNKIVWINNFGVRDASGGYLDRVDYTVFLRPRKGARFIYHDQSGLKEDKTPREEGSKAVQAGMVQVDFNTGDPAAGWH